MKTMLRMSPAREVCYCSARGLRLALDLTSCWPADCDSSHSRDLWGHQPPDNAGYGGKGQGMQGWVGTANKLCWASVLWTDFLNDGMKESVYYRWQRYVFRHMFSGMGLFSSPLLHFFPPSPFHALSVCNAFVQTYSSVKGPRKALCPFY